MESYTIQREENQGPWGFFVPKTGVRTDGVWVPSQHGVTSLSNWIKEIVGVTALCGEREDAKSFFDLLISANTVHVLNK